VLPDGGKCPLLNSPRQAKEGTVGLDGLTSLG
jgi:hypothetical protein